jgi:Protein of unknown function (DUF3485)
MRTEIRSRHLADGETESCPALPWWRSIVVVVLSGIIAGLIYLTPAATGISEAGVNMALPDSIGDYLGFDRAVSESEIQFLPKDTEFAKKAYIGRAPTEIACEVVLSGAQRNSIHRPQVCLIGQGWTITDEKPISVLLANQRVQRVRLLTLGRVENGKKLNSYFLYWFVGKDKTTDDHFQRILLTCWDRIMKGTNHRWAYVMVSGILPTTVADSEKAKEELISQLTDFVREIIPLIQKPEVDAGSDRQ